MEHRQAVVYEEIALSSSAALLVGSNGFCAAANS